jgi:hypothetical protein
MQVVLRNPLLNQSGQVVEFLSGGEGIAGVDSEQWGEFRLPLKVTTIVDANDLMP